MTESDFEDFIVDISTYFGKEKYLTRERKRSWFDACCKIPGAALSWIKKQMQADFDAMPGNVPKAMGHYFNLWLEQNPNKRAYTATDDNCAFCDYGLIFFKKEFSGVWFEKVARCGHCSVDTRQGIPMMTRSEGESSGMVFIPQEHKRQRFTGERMQR